LFDINAALALSPSFRRRALTATCCAAAIFVATTTDLMFTENRTPSDHRTSGWQQLAQSLVVPSEAGAV
jgi:hypothetical protein